MAFHCYKGQNGDRHSHYDSLEGAEPRPNQLDTFNRIVGARDAIAKSTALIGFFAQKTKWEDGVKDFLEREVFALARNAQPANDDVDGALGPCIPAPRAVAEVSDVEYLAGLDRKLATLDAAVDHDVEAAPHGFLWIRRNRARPLLKILLYALLAIVAVLIAVFTSALLSRVVAEYMF